MKIQTLLFALLLCCCSHVLLAQSQPPNSAQQQTMMANMSPGPMQAMMAKSAGTWKADVTMWQDPSQPPMKSTATVTNEMIMGGRYLSTKYSGTMMNQPFEGWGAMAYDNGTKKFYSTWMDNMSTGITMLTGNWTEPNKTIELKGTTSDPMTGTEMPMRQTLTFNSDNSQTETLYMTMNGKEMKAMEIQLSR